MSMQSFVRNLDRGYSEDLQKRCEALISSKGLDISPSAYSRAQKEAEWEGLKADPLDFFAEDATAAGIYPTETERKRWQERWLNRFRVKAHEWKRDQDVRDFADSYWPMHAIFESQGCPIDGRTPATVTKAFTTSSLLSLFPTFFNANIYAGKLRNPVLNRLVAEEIPINSHSATHIELTETAADVAFGEVAEGATFPELTIKATERTILLRKFAGIVLWTYESVRMARLNTLERSLQRAGQHYDLFITDFAIFVLIEGAGGSGAITDVATAVAGTPAYPDLVALEMAFDQGYLTNTIVAPKQVIQKILNFPAFLDPAAGILHQTTGAMPNPIGWDLVRWDSSGKVTTYGTTNLVAFEAENGVVQYTEGGFMVETDRIIDGQWERSSRSEWIGFAQADKAGARRGTGW